MTESYGCKLEIHAPANTVYDALTTSKGLQAWWTKTCEVGERVGTISIFRFGKTYNMMVIEKLARPSEVRWRCIEQYHHAPGQLERKDEWVGTTLTFRLHSPTPGQTLLEFQHAGLTRNLECYAICEKGWENFLKCSLKNYIEIGKGEPYV